MDYTEKIFEEYISEFNKSILFDSETCPVCGINISSYISVNKSPFTELIKSKNEKYVQVICTELGKNNLESKVVSELDTSEVDQINYIFSILVTYKDFNTANEVIEIINQQQISE